jgi:acyl transferase domain-containing protein
MRARDDLAIVGIACRFPGAPDREAFWANLTAGVESVTWLSDADLDAAGVAPEIRARPTYVPAAFDIADADGFDARFFGIPPDEARMMDPQQRVLLELAYEALEDAGEVVSAQGGVTGVFATAGGVTTSYLLHHAARVAAGPHGTGTLAQLGNDKDFLATRLSFKLNLTGLSLSVQTACSSSLVALHLARTAILAGDVDLAVVAASAIRTPQGVGYDAADSPILSPDGHCRPFSDDAAGTVFGSGAGVVVLKPREAAARDGNRVYAVVASTGVTNDGGAKIGYTASSVPGQAKAMARAMAAAGVEARDVGFVECHGTATRIGDPLELKALERVFRLEADDTQWCGIGSVKANIGHLEQAAGLAGLIKVALMLHRRTLVPSINFARGNRGFDFERSPFTVVRSTAPWPAPAGASGRRVAGVNALGIGGTNAFAILTEADAGTPGVPGPEDVAHLVCLSARLPEQLRAYADRMAAFVERREDLSVASVCRSINVSRSHHAVRLTGVVRSRTELLALLTGPTPDAAPPPARGEPAAVVGAVARPGREGLHEVARHLAAGGRVDWDAFYGPVRPPLMSLPTYPFSRERHSLGA